MLLHLVLMGLSPKSAPCKMAQASVEPSLIRPQYYHVGLLLP